MLLDLLDVALLVGALILTVINLLRARKMKPKIWLSLLVSNILFLLAIIYLMQLRSS